MQRFARLLFESGLLRSVSFSAPVGFLSQLFTGSLMDVLTYSVKHFWLHLPQKQEEKMLDVRLEVVTLESACKATARPSLQSGDVNVESCHLEEWCLVLSGNKRSHHSLLDIQHSSTSNLLPEPGKWTRASCCCRGLVLASDIIKPHQRTLFLTLFVVLFLFFLRRICYRQIQTVKPAFNAA